MVIYVFKHEEKQWLLFLLVLSFLLLHIFISLCKVQNSSQYLGLLLLAAAISFLINHIWPIQRERKC